MKKFLMLLLCAILMFSFVACEEPPVPEVEKVKVTLVYGNGRENEEVDVEKGSEYTLPVNVTCAGYDFLGWYIGDVKQGAKVKIEAETTFTAKWETIPEGEVRVSTKDEFLNAFKDSSIKTIVFKNDIAVPAETFITSFEGTIDGNGHKLTIENPPMDVKYQQNSEFGLILSMKGIIRNLDFETNGFKAIVLNASSSLSFENVDVYGEMNGADTNVAPYVVYANHAQISFESCDNHANIIDKMGGNHYGAAYVAFLNSPTGGSSISFNNCNNYGTLQFGSNAALFIGNPSRIDSNTIEYVNSYNYGLIQAFKSVGVKSWKNGSFDDTSEIVNVCKDGGKIETIETTITSLSVDMDGTPLVETNGAESVTYLLRFNISYFNKGTTENGGNRNMTIEYDISANDGKLPISIAQADESHAHESVGEGVLYIDPFAYDFSEEAYDVASFPSKITYYAVDKDETGFLKGSAKYEF